MKKLVYGLIILLGILHQDWWWWDSETLVFGFLPIGLAYQALISILAGVLWALAVHYCWPTGLEDDVLSGAKVDSDMEHAA